MDWTGAGAGLGSGAGAEIGASLVCLGVRVDCTPPAVVVLAGKGCELVQKRKNGPEPCVPDGILAQKALERYDGR